MTTMIDQMAADASARNAEWCARSAGQHSRQIAKGFAKIMPVIPTPVQTREPGAIEFAGDEPDETVGMSALKSLMFAAELVLGAWFVAIVCGWIYGKYF